MKKIVLLACLALAFVGLNSCDDDEMYIWDYTNISVGITVQDANGVDLLDSAAVNTVVNDGITVSYGGRTYPLMNFEEYYEQYYTQHTANHLAKVKRKALAPRPLGLILWDKKLRPQYQSRNFMEFGDFDSTDESDNISFTINWGDGKSDNVEITNKILKKAKHGQLIFERTFKLNGKLVYKGDSPSVMLTFQK